MRIYIITLIFMVFQGCSVSSFRNDKYIPYVLPYSIRVKLEQKLKDVKEPIYFYLSTNKNGLYSLYLNESITDNQKKHWLNYTNRYIFVGKKIYPLLLDYDEFFSITNNPKILRTSSPEDLEYTRISILYHDVYHIDFTTKGEILYEGY